MTPTDRPLSFFKRISNEIEIIVSKIGKKATFYFLLFFGIVIILPLILSIPNNFPFLQFDENTGVIGDTIGGITSPFINFLGAILVYLALKAQIDANNEIKKQYFRDKALDYEKSLFSNLLEELKEIESEVKRCQEEYNLELNELSNFNQSLIFPKILPHSMSQDFFERYENSIEDFRNYFKISNEYFNLLQQCGELLRIFTLKINLDDALKLIGNRKFTRISKNFKSYEFEGFCINGSTNGFDTRIFELKGNKIYNLQFFLNFHGLINSLESKDESYIKFNEKLINLLALHENISMDYKELKSKENNQSRIEAYNSLLSDFQTKLIESSLFSNSCIEDLISNLTIE